MVVDPRDQQFFAEIPIETVFVLYGAGEGAGERHSLYKEQLIVNSANLEDLAQKAAATYPDVIRGRPFCIISHQSTPDETFNSGEHFVPEGLGFGWAKLPPGFGTCDRINTTFGKYELEWLRFGSMGVFRPWFVGTGKDAPPQFYAPTKTERQFSFTRGPDGTRLIGIYTDSNEPLGLPDEGSVGELTFRVETTEANPVAVSLSLHKLAYLALWLAHPEMVFEAYFRDLRTFLNDPSDINYRPFHEEMLDGATPGASIHFFIEMREVPEEAVVGRRSFALDRLHAVVKMHHMIYALALVGKMSAEEWEVSKLRGWRPKGDVHRRMRNIRFRIGGFKKTK